MPLELPQTPGERATWLTGWSAITRNRKKIAGLLERDEKKIPDNIVSIDREIYLRLTRVCQTGILNGEKNGIARLILNILTPSVFFICHDVDRLRNFLHESLILWQMWGNGVRFDRDGLSLDAIAEVFLGINREQIQFSRKAYAEDDSKNAHIRNLYRDSDTNHAARIFFMEHPWLIPYAGYITKKLFPFGIGRSCYVWAGGNGIVIRNSESNLAFKFYYDLSRKKNSTSLKEWPSQAVFARAIDDLHQERQYTQFSCPDMEVLADNHIEMELIDGETLEVLFKRHMLVLYNVFPDADHLRDVSLDIAFRKAGLSIDDYSIIDMIKMLYGATEWENLGYFLLALEERWLIHKDIDSSIYSGTKTNVNAKNLMVKNRPRHPVHFALIDYGNVEIRNTTWHNYKDYYDSLSKNRNI